MPKCRMWAAVALLAAGPVWAQTAAQKKAAPAAAPKAQARQSDAQLEAAIRTKLTNPKSKIAADKLQVHVQGGVATIEGKTNVVQHKGTATRMAKTAGALAVNNRVQISDAAKQRAAANLESGRRRAQIKRGDSRGDQRSQSTSTPRQSTASGSK